MKELENLPKGLRIAIYGAGEAGYQVKNYISNCRPDLVISCFFDELLRGEIDGIKIYHIKDIQFYADSFDIVIPASFTNAHLMDSILKHYGVNNSLILENIVKTPCGILILDDSKLKKVQDVLFSQKSKEIYELIVNARVDSSRCADLFDYIKTFENTDYGNRQYFDYINQDNVQTVISGGAFNGDTTSLFIDRLKNLKKIYAFEPLYQTFKNDYFDKILNESGKAEVIEKGLLDKSTTTNVILNNAASRINSYLHTEETTEIQTISIDEFVKEKGIEKVDLIKMDIEGAELKALEGAKNTILSHRPYLAICIYHSYNDLFDIPLYLSNLLENYRFEVYHYSLDTNNESVFYAIPNEL